MSEIKVISKFALPVNTRNSRLQIAEDDGHFYIVYQYENRQPQILRQLTPQVLHDVIYGIDDLEDLNFEQHKLRYSDNHTCDSTDGPDDPCTGCRLEFEEAKRLAKEYEAMPCSDDDRTFYVNGTPVDTSATED